MKKILFIFHLLLFLSQIGNAQRFGVEGGLNISKPGGLISSSTSLVGIHFGPIVEFSLSEKSFIKSGLLYSEKGYKTNFSDILNNLDPGFENPGTRKFRMGYIEIPVMMAHKLPLEEEGCSLYLQGGPTISYCCTHKEYLRNKLDYGAIFGIGVERKRIKVGLNYDIGLKDVWPGMRNRVFQISAAYLFTGKED